MGPESKTPDQVLGTIDGSLLYVFGLEILFFYNFFFSYPNFTPIWSIHDMARLVHVVSSREAQDILERAFQVNNEEEEQKRFNYGWDDLYPCIFEDSQFIPIHVDAENLQVKHINPCIISTGHGGSKMRTKLTNLKKNFSIAYYNWEIHGNQDPKTFCQFTHIRGCDESILIYVFLLLHGDPSLKFLLNPRSPPDTVSSIIPPVPSPSPEEKKQQDAIDPPPVMTVSFESSAPTDNRSARDQEFMMVLKRLDALQQQISAKTKQEAEWMTHANLNEMHKNLRRCRNTKIKQIIRQKIEAKEKEIYMSDENPC